MNLDDLFNLKEEPPVEMNQKEFFTKTKELLNKILNEYYNAWQSRGLKESEYPEESICDKCQGCGVFKLESGEEGECHQDREQGECYHRFCDIELFGMEVELTFDKMYELLEVDHLTNEN